MNIGIIGTGARSTDYLRLVLNDPRFREHRVTALCDIDEQRLEAYAGHFFPGERPACFTDYRELLESGLTEAVWITTPDGAHREIALAAMEAHQHILLEKPIECDLQRATDICRVGTAYDRTLMMGFVLRHAPVYTRVREVLQSGQLGDIVTVQASEKLGYRHAGSFMRRWHRFSENSGGMMNTKCCHDMDILRYLIGSDVETVAAFGSRRFFNPVEGAAEHCCDCPRKDSCVYAFDYTGYGSPTRFSCEQDLCVYNSEKDVVDHEVMLLQYKNGVKATFELCMFSGEPTRKLVIHGTRATLEADFRRRTIHLLPLGPGPEETTVELPEGTSGHGGGDEVILQAFFDSACGGSVVNNVADGFIATATAMAAEVSMKEGRTVALCDMLK